MPVNDQNPILFVKYLQIIFFSTVILYFGRVLFIPLFFGLLVAIVMYPVCKWLEKHRWPKNLAIAASLLIVTLLLAGLFALLMWQINVLKNDAPAIAGKLKLFFLDLQNWMVTRLGVSPGFNDNWADKLLGLLGNTLGSSVRSTFNTLFILFLTPIYSALIMYNRRVFVDFLRSVIPPKNHHELDKIIHQIVHTYFNYIKGMVLVYVIVGIMNSVGLLALGVRHAILFGMLCSVMTIIPYVGIIISALLPISVVWIDTGNIFYPLGVVALFTVVQYLEANVIFPKVVGTQLNVSTLIILVSIIAGGIIWGVAGMILFIPFVAILKIMSDHIEEWKPLNLLLSR